MDTSEVTGIPVYRRLLRMQAQLTSFVTVLDVMAPELVTRSGVDPWKMAKAGLECRRSLVWAHDELGEIADLLTKATDDARESGTA
jgi:hypothetical protein